MRGDDHHAAAIAVDAVKDLAPPDGRAVPYLTMRAFIVGGSNNARPAKSRPATDTRGGRACRPGGGGSVSSCLRFKSGAGYRRRCSGASPWALELGEVGSRSPPRRGGAWRIAAAT